MRYPNTGLKRTDMKTHIPTEWLKEQPESVCVEVSDEAKAGAE